MLNAAKVPSDHVVTRAAPHAVLRLDLSNFRNYDTASLKLSAEPLVFTGNNGAGKTNLLEAISFLAPGQGLRRARLGDVAGFGARRDWAVSARVSRAEMETTLGTGYGRAGNANGQSEGAAEKRVVRIEGETVSGPAVLAEHCRIVWLTPQMDGLFLDAAAARRRFLDRLVLVLDPDHGRRVSSYERAMRERNRLLKEPHMDDSWLGALESRMAENGVAIAAARRILVTHLRAAVAKNMAPFPTADLEVSGLTEDALEREPAVDVEARLQEIFRDNRSVDRHAGRTTQGPHLSDLHVVHGVKKVPAALCSTGEQKALLVALILGQSRLIALQSGDQPVLLLDEIAAHLDEERRGALFDEIGRVGIQAWMTGTDASLFSKLDGDAQFFRVADGAVTRM